MLTIRKEMCYRRPCNGSSSSSSSSPSTSLYSSYVYTACIEIVSHFFCSHAWAMNSTDPIGLSRMAISRRVIWSFLTPPKKTHAMAVFKVKQQQQPRSDYEPFFHGHSFLQYNSQIEEISYFLADRTIVYTVLLQGSFRASRMIVIHYLG